MRQPTLTALCRTYLLNGVACVASTSASAQTSPVPLKSPTPVADAAETTGDIIVTAQRRAERLVDVPISLTALDATIMQRSGITTTRDLNLAVPALNFTTQGSWAQPAIRGISSEGSNPGSDVNVAVYIDGIYQPGQEGNVFDLPDVARVEVLRGPQGTLFGRNATGGAIQVFTLDPTYTPTGQVTASYGNYSSGGGSEYNLKGFVSTPLVDDKVAISISGGYRHDDGYLHDDIRNKRLGKIESGIIRGKLLVEPTGGIKIVASAYYRSSHDESAQAVQVFDGDTLARPFSVNPIIPTQPYHIANEFGPLTVVKGWGANLRAEFDLGGGTLTSLTGYQDNFKVDVKADVDGTSAPIVLADIRQPDRVFSQELTYSSHKSGPFSWIGGLFYYNDHAGPFANQAVAFGTPSPNYGTVITRAAAAFGEATYEITNNLTIVGGVRYSYEKKKVYAALTPDTPLTAQHHWGSWTPRASIRYEIDPRTNVYFTYSKGFKSGIYDPPSTIGGNDNPTNPEKLTSYEIGFKRSTGIFSINADAFYYDYRDLQRQIFNGVTALVQNAATARIYGGEVEATVKPVREFQFRTAVSWLPEAKYTDYPNAVVYVPTAGGGNAQVTLPDAKGLRLNRAPRVTVSMSADYTKEFSAGTLGLTGNVFMSDKFSYETLGILQQKSYVLVGAQAFWELRDPKVRLSVFAKNLTNTLYTQSSLISPVASLLGFAPPRQIGVSVGYRF